MKRLRGADGLSFIEVLTGTTVFLAMAATLAVATVTAIKENKISRDTAVAVALAHEWMEQVRGLDPWTLQQLADGSDPLLNAAGEPDAVHGKFRRSWTVTARQPGDGMMTVDLLVRWDRPERGRVEAVAYVCLTATCS